jgi:hypothetical protein
MFVLTLADGLCCAWIMHPISDILDSDQLPIVFHLLHIRTRKLSDLVDKFIDLEQFQSLVYELISPTIKINLEEEANKAALILLPLYLQRTGY